MDRMHTHEFHFYKKNDSESLNLNADTHALTISGSAPANPYTEHANQLACCSFHTAVYPSFNSLCTWQLYLTAADATTSLFRIRQNALQTNYSVPLKPSSLCT